MEIFRYKSFRGRLVPLITIGIKMDAVWYPVEVYVDSGAAYTVLHAQIANGVGFDLLGREGIFERFKICFQESQCILTFEA